MRTQSPNGSEDTDTKILNIESRNPVASLNFPTQISSEKPNTFVFNAEKSHDPDSNSRQDLQYTWRINGEKIELNNPSPSGDKGTYTFDATGEYTASVTVVNKYGKIAEAEQKFSVSSTLAGELSIQPQVTQVGKKVTFTAESQNAKFFSWNFGDGTPVEQGNKKSITHTFQRTGSYDIVLELRDNSDNSTTIRRRVYVSDMDSPFAMIDVSNSSNSAILEPGLCYGEEAYVLKRGEYSTFYGGNSINVDGGTSNLEYTWRYMGKVSTLPSINETFTDLGCFPVELTVRSKTNGATATSKIYIQLKNQAPELTNISATVDANKKDSQKVIVKTTANGATDKDGVITSYIWYYTTESDNEPQNIQITQNPNMTFILPNITEKYYFGVILEDNDGARVNSKDLLQGQTPLLLDNANGNIHMPLISLKAPNKAVKVGESVTFSAQARTIMGNDVTSKSQYAWDFDGDGKIDEKTTTSSISHVYNRAGNYTMKVRVTNNGVSNTKYQTISVRNELKASTQAYLLPNDKLYILNTSQGVFDKATWTIGDKSYENLDSLVLDLNDVPVADEK